MKQNKSNEKPSTKTSKSGCFWSIVFWGMVIFGVYLLLQDDKFSGLVCNPKSVGSMMRFAV